MARNRLVRLTVSLLALTLLSTPSLAGGLYPEADPDYAYRSAYLNWAVLEVSGRMAPIAITNQPCFGYYGSRIVVFPCPGAFVAGPAVISRRY